MVSFLDVTGIKPDNPDLSANQNALRIASGTEPTLIRKEDTTPLTVVHFLCSLHHCKRWRRCYNGDGTPLLQISDHSSTCEVVQVISSSHISQTDSLALAANMLNCVFVLHFILLLSSVP
ncbi:hypothetical protein TNCV_1498991 [Trichonephila clavipes]|nr:hypothetical protein TNCV_1498991 [Trichonephila clavipes]